MSEDCSSSSNGNLLLTTWAFIRGQSRAMSRAIQLRSGLETAISCNGVPTLTAHEAPPQVLSLSKLLVRLHYQV